MMMRKRRGSKLLVFILCLAPLLWLGWRAYDGRLTANPIEFITHYTGDWTLRLIVATLFITPLRKIFNWPNLIRYRRMIGLWAFFYGVLHFTTYIWLDKFFDLGDMLKDIEKRKYITVGFAAFVLMIPLAVTSTAGWIRRMGGKRWQLLHRAIYITAICGAIHYYWSVKSDIRDPVLYLSFVILLLAWRAKTRMMPDRRPASRPALPRTPETVSR